VLTAVNIQLALTNLFRRAQKENYEVAYGDGHRPACKFPCNSGRREEINASGSTVPKLLVLYSTTSQKES